MRRPRFPLCFPSLPGPAAAGSGLGTQGARDLLPGARDCAPGPPISQGEGACRPFPLLAAQGQGWPPADPSDTHFHPAPPLPGSFLPGVRTPGQPAPRLFFRVPIPLQPLLHPSLRRGRVRRGGGPGSPFKLDPSGPWPSSRPRGAARWAASCAPHSRGGTLRPGSGPRGARRSLRPSLSGGMSCRSSSGSAQRRPLIVSWGAGRGGGPVLLPNARSHSRPGETDLPAVGALALRVRLPSDPGTGEP